MRVLFLNFLFNLHKDFHRSDEGTVHPLEKHSDILTINGNTPK